MKLYTFWRSSAAYRVRIAMNLKGVVAEHVPVHLVRDGGEQHGDSFRAINPAGTVPALILDDDAAITQSMAIMHYLDEVHPELPFLPERPVDRARVRAAAELIACDIHPLNNTRVGIYLKDRLDVDQNDFIAWMHHWMDIGLSAFQTQLETGTAFCFSDQPSLADICLVPQLYNARRWQMDLSRLGRLIEIEKNCLDRPEFAAAHPDVQPDAEMV